MLTNDDAQGNDDSDEDKFGNSESVKTFQHRTVSLSHN